jgi:hypothetical protein
MIIKNIDKFIFVLILFCFILPIKLFSADLYFSDDQENPLQVDKEFVVKVFLDTKNESVNALEGKIKFPNNLLKTEDIMFANSFINFWINKPEVLSDGSIYFQGITPGGLKGEKILVFSILFKPVLKGSGEVDFDQIQVLKNNGQGDSVTTKSKPFIFEITENKDYKPYNFNTIDNDPPDVFKPEISKYPEIFNNKYFITFIAQDKGVGIDRYEIKEGFWGDFIKAESPYLLKNQNLDKQIYVKAIDKNENEVIVKYSPQNFKPFYLKPVIICIILLGILVLWLLIKKLLKFIHLY